MLVFFHFGCRSYRCEILYRQFIICIEYVCAPYFSFCFVDPCGICESNSLSCVTRSPYVYIWCIYATTFWVVCLVCNRACRAHIYPIHQKLRLYGGKAKERSSSHMEKDRRSILIWEALKCVCIHSRDPSRYLCCCSPATRMESKSLLYANENGYSTHQFDRKDGRGYIRGYI